MSELLNGSAPVWNSLAGPHAAAPASGHHHAPLRAPIQRDRDPQRQDAAATACPAAGAKAWCSTGSSSVPPRRIWGNRRARPPWAAVRRMSGCPFSVALRLWLRLLAGRCRLQSRPTRSFARLPRRPRQNVGGTDPVGNARTGSGSVPTAPGGSSTTRAPFPWHRPCWKRANRIRVGATTGLCASIGRRNCCSPTRRRPAGGRRRRRRGCRPR